MLLDASGKSLIEAALTERRVALEEFFASVKGENALKLSPYTLNLAEARRWLQQGGTALDGVVAKERGGPYLPGERAMMKVKQHRTADCVVGGFRYRSGSNEVGSLLLGLYDDDGKLDHAIESVAYVLGAQHHPRVEREQTENDKEINENPDEALRFIEGRGFQIAFRRMNDNGASACA